MKNLVATTALLDLALLPSTALADWNGYYGGISTGMSRNGEIEVSNSLSDDGDYPLEDSTTFGLHFGSLTQSGDFLYGGEIDLVFASDAQFANDITLEDPIIDLKGKAGLAVDRFLAYGVLGISATPATFDINDINAAGFVLGADVDITLDTIAVRASFKL